MDKVHHIGIIGTGMIGASLAVLTTGHGYKTTVFARSKQRAESCSDTIRTYYREIADQNLITQSQIDICTGYLNFAFAYSEMADVDLFFECVTEDVEIKHAVYKGDL